MSLTHQTDALVSRRVTGALALPDSALRVLSARSEATGIALEIHRDLRSVEETWRRLEQEGDCTVFQTFAWCSAWMRHMGARERVEPAVVVGRDESGEPLFILPLAVERCRGTRQLVWLAADLCDYTGPLLAKNFSAKVDAARFRMLWRDVCKHVADAAKLRFDTIVLEKLVPTIGGQRNPFLALKVAPHPSGAYLTHLGSDWESFYRDKRSSATRRRDRTKLRRLTAIGPVAFVTPETDAEIGALLGVLFEQKSRAFARMGIADLFARPGCRAFFLDVAASRELAHVSRLDVGENVAAANFALVFKGRYHHVLASYADGPAAQFGPGAAHLRELMRYAIEHGCDVFDFTIGDEPYKREWSDTEIALCDHHAGVTPVGLATVGGQVAYRRLKRLIKQTPFLWNAFTKLRVRLGGRGGGKPSDTAPTNDGAGPSNDDQS